MIQEITGYKLSNGQIIEDKDEAERIENKLEFEIAISGLTNSIPYHSEEVYEFIIDNAKELKQIFDTYKPI